MDAIERDISLRSRVVAETPLVRRLLIALAVLHVAIVIGLPFASVFWQAFGDGLEVFKKMISSKDAQSAIWLTISLAVLALPLNAVFGTLLAWGLTHVRLPGR